jgi:hypothetical protein
MVGQAIDELFMFRANAPPVLWLFASLHRRDEIVAIFNDRIVAI